MTLPISVEQREYDKFKEVSGEVAVNVTSSTISGTFTDSGLGVGGLLTVVDINEVTWEPLPLTPQASRNTICVQNRSGQGMYVGFSGVDADPVYKGWYVPDQGVQNYKITDGIILYGKSETSAVKVLVKELA